MRLRPSAAIAVCLATGSVAAAGTNAQQMLSADNSIQHSLPAQTPAATGSIEPPENPDAANLTSIGLAVRESLSPPPPHIPGTPRGPRFTKYPATQEDAELLSHNRDLRAVYNFYEFRGDKPLWVDKTGYLPRALSVIAEFKRSAYWGLDPNEFAVPDLPAARLGNSEIPSENLEAAEKALSLTVLRYMRFARGGAIAQPDRQLSSHYSRRPSVWDRKTVLEEVARSDDPGAYLASIHPTHAQFKKLHQTWLEAKRQKAGKLRTIPAGPDIKPGSKDPQIMLLRQRMQTSLATGVSADFYDEDLAKAVAGFQELRGISPADGTLNDETRTALDKPTKVNIDQIFANMHAWRYMPDDMGDLHVWVNVPEFLIRIVKNGEVIWTERITAGRTDKQTPIFSDEIELVTFKSRWRVPDSIKVQEVWPSLLKGGGMVRQHGLVFRDKNDRVVDWQKIDWTKANMEDYTLWQPPGRKNQLGVVKFSFPNRHSVFMHDTPDKYMFKWKRRANSHGCMRIRNPLEMATIILEHDQEWDRSKVNDAATRGPEHNIIELESPVPVHMTYFTARVLDGGKIQTWGDIYGHERRIRHALNGQWKKIRVPRDHLAPLDQTRMPVATRTSKSRQKSGQSVLDIMTSAFGGPQP